MDGKPLTEKGIRQAQALGKSKWIAETAFDRIYSSDLPRAEQTARIILESAGHSDGVAPLISDVRLRETAKGAREGLPKGLTEAEALEERQQRPDMLPSSGPFLTETEEEGWHRIHDWLQELAQSLASDYSIHRTKAPSWTGQDGTVVTYYNVMAVSHAGLLRGFHQRFLGDERLSAHPAMRRDAEHGGKIKIPNTGLTILDIPLYQDQLQQPTMICIPRDRPTENVEIIELTWTEHYASLSNE